MSKHEVVFHLGFRNMMMALRFLRTPERCLKHSFIEIANTFGFDIRELTDDGIHVMHMTLEEFKDKLIKFLKKVPNDEKLYPFVLGTTFVDNGENWAYRAFGFAPIVVKKASIAQADDPQEIMRRAFIFRAIEREFLRVRDEVYSKTNNYQARGTR